MQGLAKKLTELNEKRKGIEAQLTADALGQAEENFADMAAVVVTGDGDAWHPGVVGIVAGKLANSLNKPCLVLAKSTDGEYCGSGLCARNQFGRNIVIMPGQTHPLKGTHCCGAWSAGRKLWIVSFLNFSKP